MKCLDNFERFLHDEKHKLPFLVEAGLLHVKFETIRPFPLGNGRLGRLLITLLLCSKGALREPLLYLTLYFKTKRDRYYDLLQRVRTEGAWEEWPAFFLDGTEITARAASEAAKQILNLFAKDRDRIQKLGRATSSALRVHEYMQKKPLASIGALADSLQLSIPTVTGALNHFGSSRNSQGSHGKTAGPPLRILTLPEDPERRNRAYSGVAERARYAQVEFLLMGTEPAFTAGSTRLWRWRNESFPHKEPV